MKKALAKYVRVPARNALLADLVPREVCGGAYGFERMMDNLGAVGGPLLALDLVALVGIRFAIGLSVLCQAFWLIRAFGEG